MNSLEWRVKKLEDKILGLNGGLSQVDRILTHSADQDSIHDQLYVIAKQYKNYIDQGGHNYAKFIELYQKCKNSLIDTSDATDVDYNSKTELILAYEDELVKYFSNVKLLAENADKILDINKWPDLQLDKRLDKLQQINKQQLSQSVTLEKRTEELLDIYNGILTDFKFKQSKWNETLEKHEAQEKHMDE